MEEERHRGNERHRDESRCEIGADDIAVPLCEASDLQRVGAERHAETLREALRHARDAGRLAHGLARHLGERDRLQGSELQRAHAAGGEQHQEDHDVRRRGGKKAEYADGGGCDECVDREHLAESELPEDDRGQRLHEHRADGGRAGEQSRLQRIHSEADLQQERQQKRRRADADAEQAPCDDAGVEGRQPEEREVDHRMSRAPRVPRIGRQRERAQDDAGRGDFSGQEVAAEGRESQHQDRQTDSRECEAGEVERRHLGLLHVRDVTQHEVEPQHADRQIDQEDPAPVKVQRDRPAECRPGHGPEQRRNGEVVERGDELVLRHGAQQNEAPDRHHHRPADALEEARGDERGERARHGAGERPGDKHDDGARKHGARSEAVGDPAADRDEHRETDEIGGQRQLERERTLPDIDRDGRERCRDHRRVHVLHKEGTGDDKGNEDGALHCAYSEASAPRCGKSRLGRRCRGHRRVRLA